MERYLRSVFVGNISMESTEEELKDLFTECGPVISFRYFTDNTQGYVFCEYEHQDLALRALHTFSNLDYKGRSLTIDIAASDRSRQELERLQTSSTAANDPMQGTDAGGEKVPEEISKAVASLPAEQMFELMKQMKMCIENNPQEARNLLLQNPQLAYALLQAQVIMRIVDPDVAMKILNRPISLTGAIQDEKPNELDTSPVTSSENNPLFPLAMQGGNSALPGPVANPLLGGMSEHDIRQLSLDIDPRTQPLMTDKDMRQLSDSDLRELSASGGRLVDPRFRGAVDPRSLQVQDPRTLPAQDPRLLPVPGQDPRLLVDPRLMQTQDPRILPGQDPRVLDPRLLLGQMDPRGVPMVDPRMLQGLNRPPLGVEMQRPALDPRVRMEDPRKQPGLTGMGSRMPIGGPLNMPVGPRPPVMPPIGNLMGASEDQEKAALILEVLQLSEQQIAMLPSEQQQSIMMLKDQIARSQLPL